MRPSQHILLAALLALAASACGCPPLVTDYSSPARTLASWQSHLCRDDVEGEYRCLSTDFKRRTGNFESYYSARKSLLAREPLLAALLARVDLSDHLIESQIDAAAGTARLQLDAGGQPTTLGFRRETVLLVDFESGRPVVAHLGARLGELLRNQSGRQWIELGGAPPIDPERLRQARSVRLEERWKLDAIEGLALPMEGVE